MPQQKMTCFDTNAEIISVTPYYETYHKHPHYLLAGAQGWKANPSRSDFFTGKSATVMKARKRAAHRKLNSKAAWKYRKRTMFIANQDLAAQLDTNAAIDNSMQLDGPGDYDHNRRFANAQRLHKPIGHAQSPFSPAMAKSGDADAAFLKVARLWSREAAR